jgi:hypothetical protein
MKLAIVESTPFDRVETNDSDRVPPGTRGKRTHQHLCDLILDHQAALCDYSTDLVVRA